MSSLFVVSRIDCLKSIACDVTARSTRGAWLVCNLSADVNSCWVVSLAAFYALCLPWDDKKCSTSSTDSEQLLIKIHQRQVVRNVRASASKTGQRLECICQLSLFSVLQTNLLSFAKRVQMLLKLVGNLLCDLSLTFVRVSRTCEIVSLESRLSRNRWGNQKAQRLLKADLLSPVNRCCFCFYCSIFRWTPAHSTLASAFHLTNLNTTTTNLRASYVICQQQHNMLVKIICATQVQIQSHAAVLLLTRGWLTHIYYVLTLVNCEVSTTRLFCFCCQWIRSRVALYRSCQLDFWQELSQIPPSPAAHSL